MSKYKGDNGVYLTQGLFYEWNNPNAEFSLRDSGMEAFYVARNGKKYRSFPYIFRNSVSVYQCAINTLGSWEHWKKLIKDCEWFLTGKVNGTQFTGLNDWRAEKEQAEEAAALKVIMEAIEDGDLNAAKFLYDKKHKKTTKSPGRPEKVKPVVQKNSVVDLAKRIGSK